MQRWQQPFLGLTEIPAHLSAFEIRWFFTFSRAELAVIRRRHRPIHQVAMALQVGFLRMAGRPLNSVKLIPWTLLEYLGLQLDVEVPTVASVRSLCRRQATLHEFQTLAAELLGFRKMPDKARPWLVKYLRAEARELPTSDDLVFLAQRWFYERRYFIPHRRAILDVARKSQALSEAQLLKEIQAAIPSALRATWLKTLLKPHPDEPGATLIEWLASRLANTASGTSLRRSRSYVSSGSFGSTNSSSTRFRWSGCGLMPSV